MKKNTGKNYLVVTPCKNEEDYLPGLIDSMVKQNLQPTLWVIVDDNSTDSSSNILSACKERYPWIHIIKMKNEVKRDLGIHYFKLCNKGFAYGINFLRKRNISIEYLGSVDADIKLNSNYFERLIKKFSLNKKLGLACGDLFSVSKKGKQIHDKVPQNEVCGAARLWSAECYFDTGGYPLSKAGDAVSTIKCRLKGWDTKNFPDLIVLQQRPTGSAKGLWNGYFDVGQRFYYLNYNPLHILLRSIKLTFKEPYFIGFSFLCGYLYKLVTFSEKIPDKDIRSFFWSKRFKEMLQFWLSNKS